MERGSAIARFRIGQPSVRAMNTVGRVKCAVLAVMATMSPGLVHSQIDVLNKCIAPITYLPLDSESVGKDANGLAALGTYERISPDGRFILRSYSGAQLGRVSLIELPKREGDSIKVYRTPFSNEAFPVQGTWRYLVDVNGDHYRFAEVLKRQASALPLFRAGMTGFYAAASELHAKSAAQHPFQSIYIRSLSWPQGADPDTQGVGPLQIETVEVWDDGQRAHVRQTSGQQYICTRRKSTDGGVYALPMISMDGKAFSAIPQIPASGPPSMRVYSLNSDAMSKEHPCELQADLGFSPGKAVFGFAASAEEYWLTYSDLGHVYFYDAGLKQTFRLDHGRYGVLASAFPGFTRDGRVVYGATWRDCADSQQCGERAGYVVVDPLQSRSYRTYWESKRSAPPRACITQSDVRREQERFAKFHGLSD